MKIFNLKKFITGTQKRGLVKFSTCITITLSYLHLYIPCCIYKWNAFLLKEIIIAGFSCLLTRWYNESGSMSFRDSGRNIYIGSLTYLKQRTFNHCIWVDRNESGWGNFWKNSQNWAFFLTQHKPHLGLPRTWIISP